MTGERPPLSEDPFSEETVCVRLLDHLRTTAGRDVRIEHLRRYTVGFSWLTFGFDLESRAADGTVRRDGMILRVGPPHGMFAPYRASPQFTVLKALAGSGVPVPAVHDCFDDSDALGAPFFICERVDGEAPLPWVVGEGEAFAPARREALAEQFVGALAALHRFDWRDSAVAALDDGVTRENAAAVQIAAWERDLRRWELRRHPILELALEWLRARCPVAPRLSLVHGDYRIGNFLASGDRVTAILDWELAHVGDPHEDLGFMCLRAFRGRSKYMCHLVEREELYRRYGERSGMAVQPESVHFYEIFGQVKLAIIHIAAARCFEDGRSGDLRMPAMGAQLVRLLQQLDRMIGGTA